MAVDLGVQGSFVANQARIYGIDPYARRRMSGQLSRPTSGRRLARL